MGNESQVSVSSDVRLAMSRIEPTKKSLVEAYVLAVTLGVLGAHHFYLHRPWFGVAYLFTFGLLGVGYTVDLFRMPCLVREANEKLRNPEIQEEKNVVDAYLLWFPFGILGFHLFYLRKPMQGAFYFFSLGIFGIGWLIDFCRIPVLVKTANGNNRDVTPQKSVALSYFLGISPFGILGTHHYYLDRPIYGLAYSMTFGLLGVGYIADWFRMPCLVKRANRIANQEEDRDRKYIDDIYILWFPFGILGLHHFYLRRYVWGVLYMFTVGLFGIGWLVDGCRLPCLVRDYNEAAEQRKRIIAQAQAQSAVITTQVYNVAVTSANQNVMTYPGTGFVQYGQGEGYQGYQQQPAQYPPIIMPGSVPSMANRGDIPPPTYEESVSTHKPGPLC